jgi:hypothetical protein
MSVEKLIASLCYIVCVLPTLNKTYLIWFDLQSEDRVVLTSFSANLQTSLKLKTS